ncbi:MAG: PA2169 family four-helix-bundle protein [Verrucomicrobiota bacterium]
MKNEKINECLNDLLTKAYDAEEGFKVAAERAEGHPSLVSFFKKQSEMRRAFGHELKQAISQHGGTPDKGSSIAAKAHQIWISVKDTLTPDHDGEAILEECIRGETVALADYDDKLNCTDLPADVKALISKQRASIASSLAANKAKEKAAD